jgi:peptidoglycan-associated lipoprotein
MAVVLIIAITAMMTMPLLQEQIAAREIDSIARRFIAHAHFARQQALHLGQPVHLVPISGDQWEKGWIVKSGCISKPVKVGCINKPWFSQGSIDPIYFKGGGKQFIDPHSGKKSVYFGFDEYTVQTKYQKMLSAHASYLKANPKQKIIIQGNTDERGTAEYNLALGQRRSDAVRKSLNLMGVSDDQMEAVSFGKEKPKAEGDTEAAWAENRRADIVYITN